MKEGKRTLHLFGSALLIQHLRSNESRHSPIVRFPEVFQHQLAPETDQPAA